MKTKAICTYEQHAVAIAVFRSEGKYGERFCGVCGGPLQVGPRRCEHGSLINERGQSLCELCRAPHSDAVHHVSQSQAQVEAYLEPPISDKDLTAAQEESSETESIADTNLMDGMENEDRVS